MPAVHSKGTGWRPKLATADPIVKLRSSPQILPSLYNNKGRHRGQWGNVTRLLSYPPPVMGGETGRIKCHANVKRLESYTTANNAEPLPTFYPFSVSKGLP